MGAKGGSHSVLTVVVVGELGLILLLAFQVASSMGAFGVKTVTTTTTVGGPAAVDCLLPVPSNATTSYYSTQYFSGTMVTYADGEQLFYPEYACPQPISNSTGPGGISGATAYQLALAAVTNKTFVADENGSVYLYSHPCQCGQVGPNADLFFYKYENQSEPGCGNGTQRVIEAGIEAEFTSVHRFAGTFVYNGVWDLSNATYAMMTASDLYLANLPCAVAG